VTRWHRSFPQYRPGHLDRVAAIDAELAAATPTLVVAGAALRGLGVPACIRQGADATRRVLAALDA
jgi:oxygen-dependent protoporphyrinogen oxidase